MSDWSTVPVRGFRRWRLAETSSGKIHLCGIAYGLPWSPGVNEAICPLRVAEIDASGRAIERPHLPEGHPLEGCSHGFYARFTTEDGASYYPVTGMIEGWGEVIAGPDGFRAEKAKIVALMLPDLPEPTRLKKWVWFGRRYYDVPELDFITKVITDHDNRSIRKQFPDVPVFPSVKAMLKKFPIERGEYPVERSLQPAGGGLMVARGGITYTHAAKRPVTCPTCGGSGGNRYGGCPLCGGRGVIHL